jgi:hypothetical protein
LRLSRQLRQNGQHHNLGQDSVGKNFRGTSSERLNVVHAFDPGKEKVAKALSIVGVGGNPANQLFDVNCFQVLQHLRSVVTGANHGFSLLLKTSGMHREVLI